MNTILTHGPSARDYALEQAQKAVEAFRRKFASAIPGTQVPYYTGFLCHDSYITVTDSKGIERSVSQEPAYSLGRAAMALYKAGAAELLQRRVSEGTFQYLAVKRRAKAWRRADPE